MSDLLSPRSTADGGGIVPADETAAAALADATRLALAAPVADPLWLLARQWQTGAFVATDGGSPVHTAMSWSSGPVSTAGVPVRGPVDPGIEAERPPTLDQLTRARRVRLAADLQRRLRDADLTDSARVELLAQWLAAYPLGAPLDGAVAGASPVTGRLPDPVPMLAALAVLSADGSGAFPPLAGMSGWDAATAGLLETVVRAWYRWALGSFRQPVRQRPGSPPPRPTPAAWDQTRMTYQLSCAAALPTGSVALTSTDYDGSGLDWFSFDRSALEVTVTDGGTAAPVSVSTGTVEVRPGRVSYAGMPRPRWWELEDGDVNLDALRSGDDPARAVLATFAHAYSNDWFLCPLDLAYGWAQIDSLTVTDTFGTRTQIGPIAAADGDAGPWRMWDLSRPAGDADAAAGLRLFWPVSPPPLQGPVLEEILLARDEMANLAWVVELQTQDGDGTTVDRYRRYLEQRPDDPSTAADGFSAASPDVLRYRLGTAVPDFWYPLTATGITADQRLRLATLPPEASGVSDAGVRGVVLAHDVSTALAVSAVSRQGRRVLRRDRLVIGPDGVRTWRVRLTTPGDGDASSGLRFDILR